jgi:sugar-specific transcriptional regulator TrmB
MNLNILRNIGLSDGEVKIYNTLLEQGELSAGAIIKASGLKRGDCYNKIYALKKKGLIEEFANKNKKYFRVGDPNKIDELINSQFNEIADTRKMVSTIMPEISSLYKLTYHKPNIMLFEGIDGIKKVWWDTLNSKTEIYTYGDLEFLAKRFTKLNAIYLRERIKKNVRKKAITNDSNFNREFLKKYEQKLTVTKLIDKLPVDFSSVIMQIYDNKISYTTLKGTSLIGVIVEDEYIYKMHKSLFEYNWKTLR